MGCHTWFNKRLNITLEQAREDAIYICEEQIKWNQNHIDNPTLDRDWMKNDESNEIFIHAVGYFSRCKRFIEKNIFKSLETLSKFYDCRLHKDEESGRFEDGLYDYELRTNSIYICKDDLPHDIFRIGGYPENQLISYNETLLFCKDNNIRLSNEQKVQLNNFWKANPDGMIRFG